MAADGFPFAFHLPNSGISVPGAARKCRPPSPSADCLQIVSSNDQMIEQRHIEIVRNPSEVHSCSNVTAARSGVSARMIVHQDKAICLQQLAVVDQSPRGYFDTCDVASTYGVDSQQLEMLVDIEREQPLVSLFS